MGGDAQASAWSSPAQADGGHSSLLEQGNRTVVKLNNPRARVALADDQDDVRRVVERLVEQLGYEITVSVSDGAELVQACKTIRCDVALVDLDMPLLDGLETAEEVSRFGIPVILMSGHADLHSVVLDAEPFVAKLHKPVQSSALAAALEHALVGLRGEGSHDRFDGNSR